MPSKAKPIQMKTTYHVGGDTKAVPKPVDINAANARNAFNAAESSRVNARNAFNAADNQKLGDMQRDALKAANKRAGGQTPAPPALRRASQMQRMQRKQIKQMQRSAGKRSSPAATPTPSRTTSRRPTSSRPIPSRGGRPTPRNMAVTGPKRATGGRRRLGRNLSRFLFQ